MLALAQPGVLERLLEGALAAGEQVGGEVLEPGPGELVVEVERTGVGGRDERQVDLGRLGLRQLDLGLLGGLLEALQGHGVVAPRSTPWSFLNDSASQSMTFWSQSSPPRLVSPEVDLTSNTPSPSSSTDTSKVPPPRSNTRIVCSACFLVEAVGERGRGGLVDDAQHLEPGDLARLLGGGALGVVEVRGHGDHGLGDRVAEVLLGVALELHQRASRDLLRRVGLAVDVDVPARAHVALHRADRAVGVGDGLALGDLADQDLAVLGEGDHRRGGAGPLGVGDHDRVAALEDADDGVGGTEIDTDGLGHGLPLPLRGTARCSRGTTARYRPRFPIPSQNLSASLAGLPRPPTPPRNPRAGPPQRWPNAGISGDTGIRGGQNPELPPRGKGGGSSVTRER